MPGRWHDCSKARALGEHADSDTAIYIADTLGEMDSLFEASDIVFLGGSLLPMADIIQ